MINNSQRNNCMGGLLKKVHLIFWLVYPKTVYKTKIINTKSIKTTIHRLNTNNSILRKKYQSMIICK